MTTTMLIILIVLSYGIRAWPDCVEINVVQGEMWDFMGLPLKFEEEHPGKSVAIDYA